jgi:hypothetical protein
MSERLILLDVPGVLYSDRSAARLGGRPDSGTLRDVHFFDPIALGFVRRLFGLAGARVVVSGAWQRGTPAAILQQLDLQIEGMMPTLNGDFGAEVSAWCARHGLPSSYVILSCVPGEQIAETQREHLVSVDPAEGLTVANFRSALDKLGVACPSTLWPAPDLEAGLKARLRELQQLARIAPARYAQPAQEAAMLEASLAHA